MRRSLVVMVVLWSSLLLLCCASASAATRFAAPGGEGADPCADRDDPCSLFTAADRFAPGTTLTAGDEVVLAPGEYTEADDLGASDMVRLAPEVSVHGEAGRNRPRIVFTKAFGELAVAFHTTLSYVELESTGQRDVLHVGAGIVEDVIARSSQAEVTCEFAEGTFRNVVCLNSRASGAAIGYFVESPGTKTEARFRNVTAVSTGSASVGIRYRVIGRETAPTFKLDASSTIARGTAFDVVADSMSREKRPGEGAKIELRFDHSDYATADALIEAGSDGEATISPTGPGTTNIEAPPQFAADGYHQLATSPTVDKGAVDGLSGAVDIDGQRRIQDLAADIGADELGDGTPTTVLCTPASVLVGGSFECEATASPLGAPEDPLTGRVDFVSEPPGGFVPTSCQLQRVDGRNVCDATFTPVQAGAHRIVAAYGGDAEHERGAGETSITALAHKTRTSLACAPATLSSDAAVATCTATVADVSIQAATATGAVRFASDGVGVFSGGGACTLAPGAGGASCQLTYSPREVGFGTHEIIARYEGDAVHEASQRRGSLQVLSLPEPNPEPPKTTLKRRPGKKTARLLAVFTFGSDQAGSTFQCKLDRKPFQPCRSPFKARVKAGRHTFQVRAVSPGEIADPTPATFSWKVS